MLRLKIKINRILPVFFLLMLGGISLNAESVRVAEQGLSIPELYERAAVDNTAAKQAVRAINQADRNRETVFEVIFAYKGRLYFRNIDGNRVEVLVVGTKLTQNKDLTFLDKL